MKSNFVFVIAVLLVYSAVFSWPNREVPPISSSSYSPPTDGPRKSKSELRCAEYERKYLLTTTPPPTYPRNARAVGGVNALPKEFPHMIALGAFESDEKFTLICGATLISHTWALSAAHCAYVAKDPPTVALLRLYQLSDLSTSIRMGIKKFIRHPKFAPPAVYMDIALIELDRSVRFDEFIRPACLYQPQNFTFDRVSACGWGAVDIGGDLSDILQKVFLNVVDNPTCRMQLNTSREIPYGIVQSMICAGDPYSVWKKDICHGDSGGPLQVIHPIYHQLYLVVGVTSFGIGCAIDNSPGVFTRVSHYLPWIESIVWPDEI